MIKLEDNKTILTKDTKIAYKLMSGRVIVFMVPVSLDKNMMGRNVLLAEIDEAGACIPGFCLEEEYFAGLEVVSWQFLIKPMEPSILQEIKNDDNVKQEFANRCKVLGVKSLGFDEACIEHYRLILAKESASFYVADFSNERLEENKQRKIFNAFKNKKNQYFNSESSLYNSIRVLCDYRRINCPELDVVKAGCGEKFTIEDVARIGGFPVRNIYLEDEWYKKDIGPFISTNTSTGTYVTVLPKRGKYYIYNSISGKTSKLTDELVEYISNDALMVYRPLPNDKITIASLLKYALYDLDVGSFITMIVMMLLVMLVGMVLPTLNQKIYDLLIPIGDTNGLFSLCLVIIACGIGSIAFTIVQSIANIRCFSQMKYSLEAASVDRLFKLPEGDIKKYQSADIATRITNISIGFDLILQNVLVPVLTIIVSIPYIFMMNKYSNQMTKVSLIMLLIYISLIVLLGIRKNKYDSVNNELTVSMKSYLNQFISAISKLRIARAENRALNLYMEQYIDSIVAKKKSTTLNNLSILISEIFPIISTFVIYIYIVRQGDINSLGNYMAFISAQTAFNQACITLSTGLLIISKAKPLWDKIKEVLDILPEQSDSAILPGKISGNISVESVTFGYNPAKPVLKNINLNISRGEYVAIVGTSGCGKSTLLKLLLGFERPQQGKIYYDSIDLNAIDKRELRKQFGVVLQNGALIAGTIKDNILLTAPHKTVEDVEKVLVDVCLDEMVHELPMGLNTPLSDGAGGISGGQKQRILIARSIINNPAVLFFDEATSALDNRSQEIVVNSVSKLNCTRIVIAHRLSTIINCDRILVMDGGSIVEEGTYSQLMDKKGIFYKLAIRQTE